MTLRIVPREGALYQAGFTEDGDPRILQGAPYFAIVVDERLGRCDYELTTTFTLAEAETELTSIKAAGGLLPWCGGGSCRCNDFDEGF